jgi:acid stress-induced BolA-like protein IbaG/YrbA
MTEEDVKGRISSAFNDAKIQVIDTTGTGDHFSAVVISDKFDDKSLVQRHQMVYASVSDVLTGELHALQLKTFTLEEWEKQQ